MKMFNYVIVTSNPLGGLLKRIT